MKKTFFFIFFILLTLVFFSKAKDLLADEYEEIQRKINEYVERINILQKQEQTLSQQISLMDSQIEITGLRISETQRRIKILVEEIKTLSSKIIRLEDSLNFISKVLLERLAESYKSSRIDPITLFFSSRSFSEFVLRYRYLQKVQFHDRELLLSMETTRTSYDEQKNLKAKVQDEMEKLEKQLVSQKAELNSQVAVRKKLLEETMRNEKKYQQLLAQAYAEKAAVEQALVSGVKVGLVKRGDPIALVGNSGYPGCSTGKHLHFEIRKNNSWVNPGQYLSSKTVKDEQDNKGNISIGSGNWPWPIEDTVRLTQFYGQTPYSWRYK